MTDERKTINFLKEGKFNKEDLNSVGVMQVLSGEFQKTCDWGHLKIRGRSM